MGDGQEPDPAQDRRGVTLERRALFVLATAGLVAVGVVALVRSRPGIDEADVLRPPPAQERFIVYINDDDWVTIALLPRMGETLARRIVASREAQGRFRRLEDLTRVRGIGLKTLDYLRPHVRFERRGRSRSHGGAGGP